ncbi:hypothetical protein [Sphingomonas sp.]|jgi:hypothetical protein|uniref:hypothetical protein n=1 Tax=Sphingomonas sp. TaxID=28214 RepID=UPI002D7F3CAC|nr:hypothetical protein [Sphingomonas sp.]HEU0045355.1 hypothetical protein [Sphingomonas sp.]
MSNQPNYPTDELPWRSRLLHLVDEVYSGTAGLPQGAIKGAFSTLDQLRAAGAAQADVSHVERVAVELHHLQALCGTAGADSFPARAARRGIRRSTLDWLQQTRVADLA